MERRPVPRPPADAARLPHRRLVGGPGLQPGAPIIHIAAGGMAHQDSWDPKPLSPIEYRGGFGTIPTKLDGVLFNELLPRTRRTGRRQITVCRSMTHGEAAHERGTHNMFTGYRPRPAPSSLPSMGAAWCRTSSGRRNNLAALRLRAESSRPPTPAPATCRRPSPRSASAPTRPTATYLHGGRPDAARRRGRQAASPPARLHARRRQRPFRTRKRRRTAWRRWTRSTSGPTAFISPDKAS